MYKFLVVDSDEVLKWFINHEHITYNIVSCSNVSEAKVFIKKIKFDVIIISKLIPDHIGLLRHLNSISEHPLLILTGEVHDKDLENIAKSWNCAWLHKPINNTDIACLLEMIPINIKN